MPSQSSSCSVSWMLFSFTPYVSYSTVSPAGEGLHLDIEEVSHTFYNCSRWVSNSPHRVHSPHSWLSWEGLSHRGSPPMQPERFWLPWDQRLHLSFLVYGVLYLSNLPRTHWRSLLICWSDLKIFYSHFRHHSNFPYLCHDCDHFYPSFFIHFCYSDELPPHWTDSHSYIDLMVWSLGPL